MSAQTKYMQCYDFSSEEVTMFTKVTVSDPFFPKVTQHRAGESLDIQLGPPETNVLEAAKCSPLSPDQLYLQIFY